MCFCKFLILKNVTQLLCNPKSRISNNIRIFKKIYHLSLLILHLHVCKHYFSLKLTSSNLQMNSDEFGLFGIFFFLFALIYTLHSPVCDITRLHYVNIIWSIYIVYTIYDGVIVDSRSNFYRILDIILRLSWVIRIFALKLYTFRLVVQCSNYVCFKEY